MFFFVELRVIFGDSPTVTPMALGFSIAVTVSVGVRNNTMDIALCLYIV
jgi:hypothetical protein